MKLSIKLILFLLLINQTALIYAKQLVYVGCEKNGILHMFDVTQPANPLESWNALALSAPWGIAFTPDAKYTYVALKPTNTVVMIDTQTGLQVGPEISVGALPVGLTVTPDGQFVYVSSTAGDDISVINTATNTVVDTIALTGGDSFGIVFTPDGKYAYVSSRYSHFVHVIDTATRMELIGQNLPIEVGGGTGNPQGIAITPDGKFVYVVMGNQDIVEVISTRNNVLLPTAIAVGDRPFSIAITSDGKYAYVVDVDSPAVSVIDVQTRTLLKTISHVNMEGPHAIAVTPGNQYVYIADYRNESISTLEIQTQSMIVQNHPIPLGAHGISIAVSPSTMEVSAKTYATNSFLSTDYYNTITWTAPVNPFTLHYNIYRDREQKVHIATIDGTGELKYEDHKRTPGSTYHYYITAENPYGIISIADTSITVNR